MPNTSIHNMVLFDEKIYRTKHSLLLFNHKKFSLKMQKLKLFKLRKLSINCLKLYVNIVWNCNTIYSKNLHLNQIIIQLYDNCTKEFQNNLKHYLTLSYSLKYWVLKKVCMEFQVIHLTLETHLCLMSTGIYKILPHLWCNYKTKLLC